MYLADRLAATIRQYIPLACARKGSDGRRAAWRLPERMNGGVLLLKQS
jgi:hypothetical protein